MKKQMQTAIFNLYGCETFWLIDKYIVKNFLIKLVQEIEMTLVPYEMLKTKNPITFFFDPKIVNAGNEEIGVSGVAILCESHCAIHTWPLLEGFAHIVIDSCKPFNVKKAKIFCKKWFKAKRIISKNYKMK